MLLFGPKQNSNPVMDIDPALKAVVTDHLRPCIVLDMVLQDALILRSGSAMLRKSGPAKAKRVELSHQQHVVSSSKDSGGCPTQQMTCVVNDLRMACCPRPNGQF